jgi:hypothetical protein
MAFLFVPVLACMIILPQYEFLVLGIAGVVVALTMAICYKAANPRTWEDK